MLDKGAHNRKKKHFKKKSKKFYIKNTFAFLTKLDNK
jgi:hypothetical protein